MQSARSLFRRASRHIRRSNSQQQQPDQQVAEQEYSGDSDENPALQQVAPAKKVDGSTSGPSEVGPSSAAALESDLIAAAASKLGDLDSSTEDVQGSPVATSKDYIDQLFVQQRRELMSELQAIKDSHRPVSKGDQRRHLDRFLRQHLHGEVSDSASDDGSNEGSSSPRRQRRNGMVLMELEGLWRQQSVTQRLQCTRFRRDLESLVRNVVCRQEQEVQAALRLRSAGLPGNRHSGSLVAVDGGAAETASQISAVSHVSSLSSHSSAPSLPNVHPGSNVPVPPPPPPAPGQYHPPPPPPPFEPATLRQQQQQQQLQLPQQGVQAQQRPQAPQQQQRSNRLPAPAAPWLVQNSSTNTPGGALGQHQREAIITEISELVHRQLVHETLESDFRGQLEFLMMNRLHSIDSDGERVMNYVNSLPQSQRIRRNDFSHLGIHIRTPEQEAAAAAAEATSGAVPAAMMQEMSSLRSQMNMLQEMVRMSMEMQLDLQRAIRQEVSAALNQQNGTMSAAPTARPASEGNCIICLDKEVDAVLYQCGHMCVCLTCGLRLAGMGSHCPMCRAPIRDVIRAYRSQQN